MNYFLLISGILVTALSIYEIGVTTLTSQGAGVLTDKISRACKSIFIFFGNKKGTTSILNFGGMFVMILTIAVWILLLWGGNSMIFCSVENSVVEQSTEEPANAVQKIYYTGEVLSVLGTGDYKPNGDFWRIYSDFLAFTGLIMITMTITYLSPVLSGDTLQRKISKSIAFLGNKPEEIVANAWTKDGFTGYKHEFSMLSDQILEHSENLESYPVLHCFLNSNLSEEDIINIATLDESLSIMLYAGPSDDKDHDKTLLTLRKSITAYLKTQYAYMKMNLSEAPPLPDLDKPSLKNIPLTEDKEKIESNYKNIEKRRRILNTLLASNNQEWESVDNIKFNDQNF